MGITPIALHEVAGRIRVRTGPPRCGPRGPSASSDAAGPRAWTHSQRVPAARTGAATSTVHDGRPYWRGHLDGSRRPPVPSRPPGRLV